MVKEVKSAKQAKRAQRKEVKKSIAKSLKDVLKNKKSNGKGDSKPNAKGAKKPAAKPAAKVDAKGGKKVVKSSNSDSTGKKPEFKKKTAAEGSADKGEKKKFKPKPKPKAKKPLTPEERRAAKPHFKLVEGLKQNWNKVRDRSTETDVRSSTLARMVEQFKDHILAVTLRHDASRIVQSVLQFGTVEQKEVILNSLAQKASEIAKTPYGHFTILKAITYCTRPADQKKLAAALKGHFVSLGGNVIGSRTVESILQIYPHAVTRGLKAEFYGQKFCLLLPEPPRNLRQLIEQLPAKRSAILDHMRDLVQKFVQKGLLEFAYVHNLLWEYTQEALIDENSRTQRLNDLVSQLAESAPKLLSTKPGAKVMCCVITHAAAKDRKRILKTLKGHVQESLLHDSAFLGILRLVDVTDDTVNVQKSLFDELRTAPGEKYTATGDLITAALPPLLAVALHRNAHKLLLRLLAPSQRHLEPDEEGLFATAGEHSKKAPEMRRREHLLYLRSALVQTCAAHTETLMRNRNGARVLAAVVEVYHPSSVVEAVARVCAGIDALEVEETADGDWQGDEGEGEEDGEGYDEEEEGDYDEEEGDEEGEDYDEEGEYDEEEGEGDEEVDEEALAEMEASHQADKKQAGTKKGNTAEGEAVAGKGQNGANGAPAATEAPALPIGEDPTAHLFLKQLFQFEAAVEANQGLVSGKAKKLLSDAAFIKLVTHGDKKTEVTVDDSLWVDAYVLPSAAEEGQGPASVAHRLLELLSENEETFGAWLAQNRPCFALVRLFAVPSVLAEITTALTKPRLAALKTAAERSEGAKVLLQLHDLVKRCK